MDIRLIGDTLDFTNGRLRLTTTREESLAQRLQIRFKSMKGKWFLNIDYGINWLQDVLGKGRTKLAVDSLIINEIQKEPLVASINFFKSSISNAYVYSCQFKVTMVDSDNPTEIITLLTTKNGLVLTTPSGYDLTI